MSQDTLTHYYHYYDLLTSRVTKLHIRGQIDTSVCPINPPPHSKKNSATYNHNSTYPPSLQHEMPALTSLLSYFNVNQLPRHTSENEVLLIQIFKVFVIAIRKNK